MSLSPNVEAAVAGVIQARSSLEDFKQQAVDAVKASGAEFHYDRTVGIYIGPDRHNRDWVVSWDPRQSQAAAGQMFTLGKRECNWQQCECKRAPRNRQWRPAPVGGEVAPF